MTLFRKRLFASLCFFLFLGLSSCTETQTNENRHQAAPSQERLSFHGKKTSSLLDEIQELGKRYPLKMEELQGFYTKIVNEEVFLSIVQDKNPKAWQALVQFHRISLDHFRLYKKMQSDIQGLVFEYYQFLLNLCDQSFNQCHWISLYADSIYASDLFSIIKDKITPHEKIQYEDFVALIGHPGNNPQQIEKRLDDLLKRVQGADRPSEDLLDQLVNQSLYLSVKTKKTPLEPVQILFSLHKRWPEVDSIRLAFEKLLEDLYQRGSPEGVRLANEYFEPKVRRSLYYRIFQEEVKKGPFSWVDPFSFSDHKENLILFFVFIGEMDNGVAGRFHSLIKTEFLELPENQDLFLKLAESFVYRSFFKKIQETHERVGREFQRRLKINNEVEAFIWDFMRDANLWLGDIWTQRFKKDLGRVDKFLAGRFDPDRFQKIRDLSNYLTENLRNVVAYPILFVIGYQAMSQGNFAFGIRESYTDVKKADGKFYFQELLLGRIALPFEFASGQISSAQDLLYSFNVSLDQDVLRHYGISFDFMKVILSRYMAEEVKYLRDKEKEWKDFFQQDSRALRYSHQCEQLAMGQFNFRFIEEWKFARKKFFGGVPVYSIHSQQGDIVTFGNEMLNAESYILQEDISDFFEEVRLEMAPKINRMRFLEEALKRAGKEDRALLIKQTIDQFEERLKKVYKHGKDTFLSSAECTIQHGIVESDMRAEYLSREIELYKSVYEGLRVLNRYGSLVTVDKLQAQEPEIFKHDLFKNLSSEGLFIDEANRSLRSLTEPIHRSISDFDSVIGVHIGFSAVGDGRFQFNDNFFVRQMRQKAAFFQSRNTDFPVPVLTHLPRNVEAVAEAYQSLAGRKLYDFHGETLTVSDISKERFAARLLKVNIKELTFETNPTILLYRHYLFTMAAMIKAEAVLKTPFNTAFDSYKTTTRKVIEPLFQISRNFLELILRNINLNRSEVDALQLMNKSNFHFSHKQTIAKSLFTYQDYLALDFRDLGFYDLFFQLLTAYQLGHRPDFRLGLYNLSTFNPIVASWIPRMAQIKGWSEYWSEESMRKHRVGNTEEINVEDAESLRINLLDYLEANSESIQYWNEKKLFPLQSPMREMVLKDYFHISLVDQALIENFIDWVQSQQMTAKNDYFFDLYRFPEPLSPVPLKSFLIDNYRDSQEQFHRVTNQVFKEAEKLFVPVLDESSVK